MSSVQPGTGTDADDRARIVLVTDAELLSAVAVIRSLGRAGWHVVAVTRGPHAPGLRSRYAHSTVVLPAGGVAAEEAEALLDAVLRFRVGVLIPVTDQTLLVLDRIRDRLPPWCTVATADPVAVRATQDKVTTLALAAELGIPVPESVVVRTAPDPAVTAGSLGWPVVVKPRFSRVPLAGGDIARCTTGYAHDANELTAAIAAQPPDSSTLLQRYHAGEAYGLCLLTVAGRPLSAFSHHRLREVPPSGGVSALRESVPLDPQLDGYARALLERLGWTGLAMVEFKVDAGRPLLMEINGRIWGSLPLATRSGMDFPRQLAELFRAGVPDDTGTSAEADGHAAPVDVAYRIGVRSRQLRLELDWIEAVLRRRDQPPVGPPLPRSAAIRAALSLLQPGIGYDGVALDDLRPAFTDLGITIRQYRQRAARLRSVPDAVDAETRGHTVAP